MGSMNNARAKLIRMRHPPENELVARCCIFSSNPAPQQIILMSRHSNCSKQTEKWVFVRQAFRPTWLQDPYERCKCTAFQETWLT